MSDQSLADQMGWSITTRDYLDQLGRELDYAQQRYNDMVGDLERANYFGEPLSDIQQMNQIFQENINELKKHLWYEHIEYIDKQSEALRAGLSKFQ